VGPRMGESIGIGSLLGGWAMPKAYSGEMRERVIAEVESGASRREAAEDFAVSTSTAVIWGQVLSADGPLRGQTAGRKHLTIGEACGFSVGSD
jgi:transposase-like protein